MSRYRTAFAAAAIAASSLAGWGAAHAQSSDLTIDTVDVTAYPTIVLEVSAPPGFDAADVAPADFSVSEDGKAVDATIERMSSSTLEVQLVIDTSGSMKGAPLAAAKEAIAEFVAAMPADVRIGAIGFGAVQTLLTRPTTDRTLLLDKVNTLVAEGDTGLYDAVTFAVGQFAEPDSNHALVLLSDGGDTASFLDLPGAAQAAAASGARFSVISLVTSSSNDEALNEIASAGGGTVSSVTDPSALASLYRKTAGAVLNRFLVTYPSEGSGRTEVTVALRAAGDTLTATRELALPLPEAPTTTIPSTTLPPTTVPVPTDPPPPTAPPTTPAPKVIGAVPVDPDRTQMLKVVGLICCFLALALFVLVAIPKDRRARLARANLALRSATAQWDNQLSMRDRITGRVQGMLERSGQSRPLGLALEASGMSLSAGEFTLLAAVAGLVAAIVGLLLGGALLALILLVVAVIACRIVLARMADKRREKFADQLPDTMQMLTSTLRSGYGLLQGFDSVASQAEDPIRNELKRALLEQRVGMDLNDSLYGIAARMKSRDFEWVAGAVDINREVGGDLAAILDNVSSTIRDRRRVARQIKTLSAEGRISAQVLMSLPPAVGGLLWFFSPDYIGNLGSPGGLKLLAACAVLMSLGWLWLRKIVKVDF